MNILLIVDPQNDFINGSLKVKGATDKMELLTYLIKNKNIKFDEIYITLDSHPKNHCSFVNEGGEWPPHCIDSTFGWQVYEPLQKVLNDTLLDHYLLKGTNKDKEEYSIFQNKEDGKEFLEYLNSFDKKDLTINIAGIAGDYCVYNTILDLIKLGFKNNIKIITDVIASIDNGFKLESLANKEKLVTI